jgi:hypothetical protein
MIPSSLLFREATGPKQTNFLREFADIPPLVAKVIRNVKSEDQCPLSNSHVEH